MQMPRIWMIQPGIRWLGLTHDDSLGGNSNAASDDGLW